MSRLPNLADYARYRLADKSIDSEERAKIENFILDERPPVAGADLYARYLKATPITDQDDWQHRHRNFVAEEINLDVKELQPPWTFRPENASNRLLQIDPRIYLVRVEDTAWLCDVAGTTPEQLRQRIHAFQNIHYRKRFPIGLKRDCRQ